VNATGKQGETPVKAAGKCNLELIRDEDPVKAILCFILDDRMKD
jgi:hypothetical protein